MKHYKTFPIAILLIVVAIIAGVSCRREHMITSGRIVGKLLFGPCENYVVQVISGPVDSNKILRSWPDGDTTYKNVFTVANRCAFAEYGIKPGQEFSFLMNDTVAVNNCMQCYIYIATPNIYNTVNSVQPMP